MRVGVRAVVCGACGPDVQARWSESLSWPCGPEPGPGPYSRARWSMSGAGPCGPSGPGPVMCESAGLSRPVRGA